MEFCIHTEEDLCSDKNSTNLCLPLPSVRQFALRSIEPLVAAPTRVEFLFQVPLGIGALFRVPRGIGALLRVGTLHSSIPLHIALRSCQGKTQKHGSTCLLRKTMTLANNVFRKIYAKRKDSTKFLLCITFLGSSKCSNWFKLNRIAEKFYSVKTFFV